MRVTSCCAARLASRARAARMMRATIDSATLMLVFSQCSSAGRTCESTADITSGLLRRSLVCPWNCGSCTKTLSTATRPSRMSSAVSVTPFGDRLCVSMKLRTALPSPARNPFSCVPPEAGRDAVDVAAHVLVGRLRPLQREVEAQAALVALLGDGERRLVHRPARPLLEDLLQVVGRAPRCAGRRPSRRVASSSNVIFTPLCR